MSPFTQINCMGSVCMHKKNDNFTLQTTLRSPIFLITIIVLVHVSHYLCGLAELISFGFSE